DQRLAQIEHERLEIWLVLLDLTIAAHALVGGEADDRVLSDPRPGEIDGLHAGRLRGRADTRPPGGAEGPGAQSNDVAINRDDSRRDSPRLARKTPTLDILCFHVGGRLSWW